MKVSLAVVSLASSALAADRTSPPEGCVHVAESGADHSSLQAAVDAISTSEPGCIFVDQGTYTEQVFIADRDAQLTIYGYTTDTTSYAQNGATVTFNNNAGDAGNNDKSATIRVHAANTKIYNLNIVNSFGKGSQALALSAQASSAYYGVQLYGFQDTLLANEGLEFYSNSLITGATDFIFGQRAQAWFENVDIRVRNGGQYITANGRDSDSNPSYYVINGGTIATAEGESVSDRSYFLGRAWRDYARVVFQTVDMAPVIRAEGWKTWNADQSPDNIFYGEYGNTGEGAEGERVSWYQDLGQAVTREEVLGDGYASEPWYDAAYPN